MPGYEDKVSSQRRLNKACPDCLRALFRRPRHTKPRRRSRPRARREGQKAFRAPLARCLAREEVHLDGGARQPAAVRSAAPRPRHPSSLCAPYSSLAPRTCHIFISFHPPRCFTSLELHAASSPPPTICPRRPSLYIDAAASHLARRRPFLNTQRALLVNIRYSVSCSHFGSRCLVPSLCERLGRRASPQRSRRRLPSRRTAILRQAVRFRRCVRQLLPCCIEARLVPPNSTHRHQPSWLFSPPPSARCRVYPTDRLG